MEESNKELTHISAESNNSTAKASMNDGKMKKETEFRASTSQVTLHIMLFLTLLDTFSKYTIFGKRLKPQWRASNLFETHHN